MGGGSCGAHVSPLLVEVCAKDSEDELTLALLSGRVDPASLHGAGLCVPPRPLVRACAAPVLAVSGRARSVSEHSSSTQSRHSQQQPVGTRPVCKADLVLHLQSKTWQVLSMECQRLGLPSAGRKHGLSARSRVSDQSWVVAVRFVMKHV